MGCFSCLSPRRDDVSMIEDRGQNCSSADFPDQNGTGAKSFTFQQLINATRSFKVMIGEGGFGKVYKGKLENGQASCFTSLGIHGSVWFSGKNEGKEGKIVAIKWLNHEGIQGSQEFIMEVLLLSLLRHSNLVCLIGYCTDGDQRLLVYEYMPMGSLEDHLFDVGPNKAPLEWNTRIKIAVGTARGLEYLHCKANPPVIYRDLKSANILLDNDFHPKLSDFGLAKFGPVGDNTHVTTRVMGTHGYCAPEYAMSGKLTLKSDVYSFGVVLLELITGRMAIDSTRLQGEQNLVNWARPLFKDRRRFSQLVDPLLRGRFPVRCLHHAIAITAMCLQEQPTYRPLISDVLVALEYLASQPYNPEAHSHSSPRSPSPSSPLHA